MYENSIAQRNHQNPINQPQSVCHLAFKMDVLGVKIIVLLLIAALKLLSGVAPMFLLPRLRGTGIKKRKLDKIMAGVLCVGGGFLLATVFVHMIPEVRDTFATALKKMRQEEDHGDHEGHDHHDGHGHDEDHHDDYPYAELLVCLGFFTIYLLEAVVHKVRGLLTQFLFICDCNF